MTPDEIAAMQADALAGTPGEWVAEEKPGQFSEHGSKSSIGLWAQARWDSAYEAEPDDTDAADDAAWLCGIWGKLTDEDHANARRIARVPRMEAAVAALTAELATLQAMNAKLFGDFNIHAAELAAERQARARYQDKCEGMAEQAEADQIKIEAQAAEIARLKAVMGQMQEGWANALELDLIPERHRASATILRDTARATLEAKP